jgi:hypothetical protein
MSNQAHPLPETQTGMPTVAGSSGAHFAAGRMGLCAALALFCGALGVFLFHVWQADVLNRHGALIDDAYISLRYSLRVAQGHGFVWQPGDRVEGYTNFLWVVILAACMSAGLDGIVVARALGVALGGASILLVMLILGQIRRLHGAGRWPIGAAAVAVGLNYQVAFWAISGLETSLFVLLGLLGLYLAIRMLSAPDSVRVASGVALALAAATLTRPDGAVLFAAIWFALAAHRCLSARRWSALWERPFLALTLTYTAAVLLHFLWRYSYYGQPLPNTFYVKVGSSLSQVKRGVLYIRDTAISMGLQPLLVLAPFLLLPPSAAERDRCLRIWTARLMLAGMAGAYTLYLALVGGDVFGPRLFLTVFALLACGFELALANIINLKVPRPLAAIKYVLPVLAVGAALYGSNKLWAAAFTAPDICQLNWNRTGQWLREHADPHDVLAVDAAGAMPYLSGLRSVDMLGLNDAHIAHLAVKEMGEGAAGHEKFDPVYVYQQTPTWLATWIHPDGQALTYGVFRWPEVHDYRLFMVVQMDDPAKPWMRLVDSSYDPSEGFKDGYRYAVWRRTTTAPRLIYSEPDLDDPRAVGRSGVWKPIRDVNGRGPYWFSDVPESAMTFEMDGGSAVAAVTLTHDWSGHLRLEAGGRQVVCDLYSERIAMEVPCILPPVGKPGERLRVTAAVDPGRNPASRAGQVMIRRIVVMPPATYERVR